MTDLFLQLFIDTIINNNMPVLNNGPKIFTCKQGLSQWAPPCIRATLLRMFQVTTEVIGWTQLTTLFLVPIYFCDFLNFLRQGFFKCIMATSNAIIFSSKTMTMDRSPGFVSHEGSVNPHSIGGSQPYILQKCPTKPL